MKQRREEMKRLKDNTTCSNSYKRKRKKYNEPILKEIGRVCETTKGGAGQPNFDSGYVQLLPPVS